MKNFYCSFLNSPEAFVLGNRLIYQDQPGKELREAEPAKGAKKEGSGLWDFAKRGQKETQKKLDRLDFLALKAKIDLIDKESTELTLEWVEMQEEGYEEIPQDFLHRQKINNEKMKAIGKELNDRYKIGVDFDEPHFGISTQGENIVVFAYEGGHWPFDMTNMVNINVEIRPDGTFRKEEQGPQHVITDSRKGGKLYILPSDKKAPDEF